jgi:hypothetical protein
MLKSLQIFLFLKKTEGIYEILAPLRYDFRILMEGWNWKKKKKKKLKDGYTKFKIFLSLRSETTL